jgi:endonuclease/exonuclease/phosphatase family metal-dependent hydrolase
VTFAAVRILALTTVAALLGACGPDLGAPPLAGGGVRPATVVRVATWNVHDLFDEHDREVPPGDQDLVPAAAEVEAKLDALAAVLARLDADLVVLQEVEDRALLGRLAARAGYPEARLVEGSDPRGIDVAALSRLPIEAYVSHRGEIDSAGRPLWPRDCVEVHALAAGRRLVVVASHFSSALSDGGTRRHAQATRMREIADLARGRQPGARVLAGGDLNDVPGSVALAPLVDDGGWVDAAPAGDVTWQGASGSARLDYLLLAREDAARLVAIGIASGADVARASDHRPVVVDLAMD